MVQVFVFVFVFLKFKAYGLWTGSFLLCWRREKEVRWGCNKVQSLRLVGLRFIFCVELEEEKKKRKQKVIKCKALWFVNVSFSQSL